MSIIAEIDKLIAATETDRVFFHTRFIQTHNHGHSIEAMACAIRLRALHDARDVIAANLTKEN